MKDNHLEQVLRPRFSPDSEVRDLPEKAATFCRACRRAGFQNVPAVVGSDTSSIWDDGWRKVPDGGWANPRFRFSQRVNKTCWLYKKRMMELEGGKASTLPFKGQDRRWKEG